MEWGSFLPNTYRYGAFFTPLPLSNAFQWFDNRHHFASRRHIGPSDDELRQVFNVAQLMPMPPLLRLASFDGKRLVWPELSDLCASTL